MHFSFFMIYRSLRELAQINKKKLQIFDYWENLHIYLLLMFEHNIFINIIYDFLVTHLKKSILQAFSVKKAMNLSPSYFENL
jgi:hypothetical protein